MTTRSTAAAVAVAFALSAGPAMAEVSEVRVAQQFGVSYLPLIVMDKLDLIEKHAKAAGLGTVKLTWVTLTGGAPMNDALISGSLDIASGGVGPLLTIWARTRSNIQVKAISSINSMPLVVTSINPAVKTIRDFTEKDRIALPSVKVSVQAVTLQMAAEQMFGQGKHDVLDRLTVSLSHPDATAAILSGQSEISAHFTSAPFYYQQIASGKAHKVLSSYDVLGGPGTFNSVWTTTKFREQNPKTYKAILAALDEAMTIIASEDKGRLAQLYIDAEKSRLPVAFVEQILKDPDNVFTTVPQGTMKYAEFMFKIGAIKEKAASWKDYYFADIHDRPGS